ncbi:MAG: carbohydrate ABC transporter permease [Clostridiales bacterium]|jgi:putative aldouronate transport system permease protein|nr:carbohydrate ABC transporter permease [Clostridiales bacterium]
MSTESAASASLRRVNTNRILNRVPWYVNAALHLVFAAFSLACLAPLLLLIMVSVTPEQTLIRDGYQFFPRELTFEAYRFLFQKPDVIVRAYSVTLFVVILGTVGNLLVTVLYAYPISRMDFPFRNFFSMLVVITMLFSGGLTSSYLINVSVLHLRDSIWSLIVPAFGSAFYIIIARTFFRLSVPPSLIESARIDGAGEYRILFRIVLPLSLPMLATIGLFALFGYWNDWFRALLYISDKNLYPLQFVMMRALLNLQEMQRNIAAGTMTSEEMMTMLAKMPSETLRMAMAVVAIGPVVLAYPFFQRYFISGLTVGAVKG